MQDEDLWVFVSLSKNMPHFAAIGIIQTFCRAQTGDFRGLYRLAGHTPGIKNDPWHGFRFALLGLVLEFGELDHETVQCFIQLDLAGKS